MRFLATVFLSLSAAVASAALTVYPAGPGVETNNDYSVRVRQDGGEWLPVATYPVKVDRTEGGKHNVEVASMAYFDFDGNVEVEVVNLGGATREARVRPLSYAIPFEMSGDTLRFSLDRPRNLSVEFNGDIFHNLHLFANPLDTNRPAEIGNKKKMRKRKDLVYFAPGIHHLDGDTMRIPSGTTVYIDGGARVVGQLIADGVHDVKFFGRGEVHPEGRGEGIYIKRSRNIEADGVIVTQIPVGESDSVSVNNVKSISSYGWGDGMNVFASNNVSYDGVFCRNSDDCSTVYATRKGFNGGCRNIEMKNSTLWADVAHAVMIGLHGNSEIGDTITNVAYRNIDILDHAEPQIDYMGCMAINNGDNIVVDGVTFDNIRVEDIRGGNLINMRVCYNKKYCTAPGRGIRNVLFKDVTYNGGNAELSIMTGYNEDRRIENVVFDNLVINGVKYFDDMPQKPKWYKTSDFARIFIGEHVDNVVFK